MFGLLKYKQVNEIEYKNFRQNYCGTCKTIGKIYGAKERLFLNFDIVFLSELIQSITNSTDENNFDKPYSCFNLPKTESQIPLHLKFAASANVLLGYYKILDNIVDSKFKVNIWKPLNLIGKHNFRKARKYLETQGLPTQFIDDCITEQFKREKLRIELSDFTKTFKFYSNYTGLLTREVFKCSINNLSNQTISGQLSEIGKCFGEIVYLIDAIEDYKRDKKNKRFNLLLLHNEISHEKKALILTEFIHQNFQVIEKNIASLPISEEKKSLYCSRMLMNINERLNKIEISNKNKIKPNVKERYNLALQFSKTFTNKKENLMLRKVLQFSLPLFFIAVFILFPFLVHAQHDHIVKAGCVCEREPSQVGRECGDDCCGCCKKFEKSGAAPTCCPILLLCGVCSYCCGGSGGGDGPKVITITKIIEVDKGCGGCK